MSAFADIDCDAFPLDAGPAAVTGTVDGGDVGAGVARVGAGVGRVGTGVGRVGTVAAPLGGVWPDLSGEPASIGFIRVVCIVCVRIV